MATLVEKLLVNNARREAELRSLGRENDIELTDEVKRSVMASCDVRSVLESWGCCPVLAHNEWRGYCPDHSLHAGHRQHAQKWYMNAETGDSICFTSSKKSNFIYIAKRMWNLPTISETIRVLTNSDVLSLPPPDFVQNDEVERKSEEEERKREEELKRGIMLIKRLLAQGGCISDECLEYFARDGIRKETLDILGVCSIDSGFLEGRALIPFVGDDGDFCGYVAVMYKSKEWWVQKTYDKLRKIDSKTSILSIAKNYRKALYCPGFSSARHLYGLREVIGDNPVEYLVLVEGERDAMKLLQEGIYCVSLHGTSIKDGQLPMLKKINPRRIYLGFDMDRPGCVATMKAYRMLSSEFEFVGVMDFPDGKDPKKFVSSELTEIIADADRNSMRNLSKREEIASAET